jgi:hypothetical protein
MTVSSKAMATPSYGCIRGLLVPVIGVLLVVDVASGGVPMSTASPESVFASFHDALRERDGMRASKCVTEEFRNDCLLWWCKLLPQPNEDARDACRPRKPEVERVTRELLPATVAELRDAFARSLPDASDSFVKCVRHLPEDTRIALAERILRSVTIDGDTAVGKYERSVDSMAFDCYFTKSEDGWRIDVSPMSAGVGVQPRPFVEWEGDGESQRHETPEASWKALWEAVGEFDYQTAWHSCTEAKRREFMFESAKTMRGDDSYVMAWYQREDASDATNEHKADSYEQKRNRFIESLRDERAFFAMCVKRAGLELQQPRLEKSHDSLRMTDTRGRRARGVAATTITIRVEIVGDVVKESQSTFDRAIYFMNTGEGWLVDVATPAEEEADRHTRDDSP